MGAGGRGLLVGARAVPRPGGRAQSGPVPDTRGPAVPPSLHRPELLGRGGNGVCHRSGDPLLSRRKSRESGLL